MELYETYLELLGSGGAAALGLMFRTGGGLFALGLIGLWLPLVLMRDRRGLGPDGRSPNPGFRRDWVLALPIAAGGGLVTAVTVWTLSLFALGNFSLGNQILYAACFVGAALAWKGRGELARDFDHPVVWLCVSVLALGLGLWQHAATELPVVHDVPRLVFSDLQRDLGVHVNMAGLVRDGGLPMQSLWGSADSEFWWLSHTGHLVLIAGFSQWLGVSLYQASSILWIAATILIAWAALALFAGTRIPGVARVLLVLGTLVWGAFAFPELHRLYDPLRELATGGFELDAPGYWVAGRGFWNLPQTLSIALTLCGLLVFEAFAAARRSSEMGWGLLVIASAFLVGGGWSKPSLIIFYGPALVLWLALNRSGIREYSCVLLPLAGGALVYAVPALFFTLPDAPVWRLAPNAEQWTTVFGFALMASPSLVILSAGALLRMLKQPGRPEDFRVLDLALLAGGGSLLFALFFSEDQFVGFKVFQPNIWWGMSACIVLLVPILGREAFAELGATGWRRVAAFSGLGMGLVHVFNGLCLAIAYPTLNLRGHSVSDVEVLTAARGKTASGTRFAIDPLLEDYDLVSYLSRPVIMPVITPAIMPVGAPLDSSAAKASRLALAAERRDLEVWRTFLEGRARAPEALPARFDALIVHRDRRHAAGMLLSRGWRRETLAEDFELWTRGIEEQSKADNGSDP
jgi:hypothetical protein